MSGIVQIALDRSAQFNPKQDQVLLSRGFLCLFPDEKKMLWLPSSHTAGQCGAGPQPQFCSLGASFLRERGAAQFLGLIIVQCQPQMGRWGESSGPSLPGLSFCTFLLSASLE